MAHIEAKLKARQLKIVGFFGGVSVVEIPEGDVARLRAPDVVFMNVNTPEERILAEAHGASTVGGRDRQEA